MQNELSKMKVGFIALGDIGMPMARNLLKNGVDLTVYDLRKDVVDAAVKLGAKAAGSLKDLATRCEYICIAVVNEAQMEAVTEGPGGIFANAAPGSVILAHSTMPPEVAKQFGQRAADKGFLWLDAPMSGARIAAEDGTLTFLVGGDAALLDRCRPILNAMGTHIFHLGPIGNGQVAKLVNGVMFHVGYVVTLEALKLANAYGVSEEQIMALAAQSTGNSWVVKHWGYMDELVLDHSQGPQAVIYSHLRKDINDALIAAKTAKKSMPMTALAMQEYPELMTARMLAKGHKIDY